MATTTYHVGEQGFVRKLINNTGPWIDVSPSYIQNRLPPTLRDVMTDPNDPDKVFVVGQNHYSPTDLNSSLGIWVSSDGGTTWSIPTGTYLDNIDTSRWEVWCIDSLNIVVSGDDGINCYSTDGGITFISMIQVLQTPITPTGPPADQNSYSIHFLTALGVGVVGGWNNIFKTVDGGTIIGLGWVAYPIILPGNLLPGRINGIHISANAQTIIANGENYLVKSINAGLTWTIVYAWIAGTKASGLHLTWKNDNELWATGSNNLIINTTDAFSTFNLVQPFLGTIPPPPPPISPGRNVQAAHFYLSQEGYTSRGFDEFYTIDGGYTLALSETAPFYIQAVWTHFTQPPCYRLTSCIDPTCFIVVDNPELDIHVGDSVKLCAPSVLSLTCLNDPASPCRTWCEAEVCPCFIITVDLECVDVITVDLTGAVYFQDTIDTSACDECLPKAYLFTDCADIEAPFTTTTDFSAYLGLIVNLSNCGDTCWEVSIVYSYPTLAPLLSVVTKEYETCLECLPIVPLYVPINLIKRKVKPGYDTPGCSTEYTERISCKFAEQVYDEMVKKRYGITVCCEYDINYWSIKKQILNLKGIYDADPVLIDIPCTCFLITQTVGTTIYSYVLCDGALTSLTLTVGDEPTYVCTKYAPCVTSSTLGATYTIVNSLTECTNNNDCNPL
jgi:hypothetical protein